MNIKKLDMYKGGLERIKSNGTVSKETVERATINVNKMTEDLALDNLFEEGISSNAEDALSNKDISVKKINTDDGSWDDGKITFEKQDNGAYIIYKEVDGKKVAMGWTDKAGKQAYKNTKISAVERNSDILDATTDNTNINSNNISDSKVSDITLSDIVINNKNGELYHDKNDILDQINKIIKDNYNDNFDNLKIEVGRSTNPNDSSYVKIAATSNTDYINITDDKGNVVKYIYTRNEQPYIFRYDTVGEALNKVGSNIATLGAGVIEGAPKFVEGMVDFGASVGGKAASLLTGDKSINEKSKEFVSNDYVGDWFDKNIYNTKVGKHLQENASVYVPDGGSSFEAIRDAGNLIGETLTGYGAGKAVSSIGKLKSGGGTSLAPQSSSGEVSNLNSTGTAVSNTSSSSSNFVKNISSESTDVSLSNANFSGSSNTSSSAGTFGSSGLSNSAQKTSSAFTYDGIVYKNADDIWKMVKSGNLNKSGARKVIKEIYGLEENGEGHQLFSEVMNYFKGR